MRYEKSRLLAASDSTRKSATDATFSRLKSYSYTLASIDESMVRVKLPVHNEIQRSDLCIFA